MHLPKEIATDELAKLSNTHGNLTVDDFPILLAEMNLALTQAVTSALQEFEESFDQEKKLSNLATLHSVTSPLAKKIGRAAIRAAICDSAGEQFLPRKRRSKGK